MENKINEIKNIINNWGAFSISDIELQASPVYNSISKDNFQLVERFDINGVDVITYIHETVVNEEIVEYENLSDELIDKILLITRFYDEQMNDEY